MLLRLLQKRFVWTDENGWIVFDYCPHQQIGKTGRKENDRHPPWTERLAGLSWSHSDETGVERMHRIDRWQTDGQR